MNKKNVIIIIIIILILGFCGLVYGSYTKNQKENEKNIAIIKSAYDSLSGDIKTYNQIRSEYNDMLSNFFLETYKDSHESYQELLTKYNEVVKSIDSSVKKMDQRCNHLYEDITINNICTNYSIIYEKLINLYVTDLNIYNSNIEAYNEYKKENIEKFAMIHSDYIDYNNDGIYEGRDMNEEN